MHQIPEVLSPLGFCLRRFVSPTITGTCPGLSLCSYLHSLSILLYPCILHLLYQRYCMASASSRCV